MTRNTPILILGLGNAYLTDDGIAIKLIEDLQCEFHNPLIHFLTACCGGLDIVELMQGYEDIILLDAIKTRDGCPGSVYYFSPDDFKETLHASSFHDISFLTALKFGKLSGLRLPESIQIIAIEIVEDMYFSEYFSNEINQQYNTIKHKIKNYLINQLKKRHIPLEIAVV